MASMQDIAVRAGVSRAAVSFVLNERQRANGTISEETRQRILEAAAALDYRRNELARAVVTGQNRMLGFVTALPAADAVMRMLVGAIEEAETQGFTIKVMHLRNERVIDQASITRCQELRLAGVVALYLAPAALDYLRHEMAAFGIPVAVADDQVPQAVGLQVVTDYGMGMGQVVAHLVGEGHRRIAFLGARSGQGEGAWGAQARVAGFRAAMRRYGLTVKARDIIRSPWETGAVEAAVTTWLRTQMQTRPRPTALVTATDPLALIACRAARARGLRLPHELSVVGFGNLTMAECGDPSLTTVEQPFGAIGATTVRHLIERSAGINANLKQKDFTDEMNLIQLPTQLVARSSTMPPGNAA